MRARASAVAALTVAVLFLSAVIYGDQNPEVRSDPTEGAFHLPQQEVPYALRAEQVLRAVGHLQELAREEGVSEPADNRSLRGLLETMGLDPDSPAGRHLLEVAAEYYAEHPSIGPEPGPGGRIPPRNVGLPLDRYEAAGEALGKWLRAREAEAWAILPLIDRLFNGPHLGVGYSTTDGGRAVVEKQVTALERAFQRGLRRELGYVPRRFNR